MLHVLRRLGPLALTLWFAGVAPATRASAEPVVLTGNYLEVGISDYGTFGSDGGAEPGLLHDPTGKGDFAPGGISNDYLTPGTPHDGFAIHSTETGLVGSDNDGSTNFTTASPTVLTGRAAGGYDEAATSTVTYGTALTVTNSYFFNKDDEQVRVVTVITANTDLTNVAFARSVDPDPDVNGFNSYSTDNTRGDAKTSSKNLVSAAGADTGLTLGILNGSGNRYGHNTEISTNCCSTDDPYTVLANADTLHFPDTNSGDYGLQMAWQLGNLTTGQSVEIDYSYVFGTNQGTVSDPDPTPEPTPPTGRGRVINTVDGDVAADVFSLGSRAARASTVTFDGGTLQMVGGSFPDNVVAAPVSIMATGGTVDTSTGDGGFSGTVSGPGSLTVGGGGTFVLSAANSYAGGTVLDDGSVLGVGTAASLGTGPLTVDAGTLRAEADGLVVTNAAELDGPATVDTQTYGLVLAGSISGTGSLTKTGSGTLLLLSPNSYAGGTEVMGGTLALGSGAALGTGPLTLLDGTTLAFASGGLTVPNDIRFAGTVDPAVDTGPLFETLSGSISGPGALTKLGSGTLDLTGTSTYTGATTVGAGTLLVDGSVATSVVTVDGGALLGGSGTVGGLVLRSGAVLATGRADRIGTLSVAGDLTLDPGSTYRVVVDGDGQGSRVAAAGTASINGATLDVVAGRGPFVFNTTYTLLSAAGGVSGTFAPTVIDPALSSTFLQPIVSYDANDVLLTLRVKPFDSVATTPNEGAVARGIQSLGPNGRLFTDVLLLSPDEARQAFSATSGVSHAGSTTAETQATRVVSNLILDRLWDIGGSGLGARQLLEKLAPDTLPTLVRCYAPPPAPVPGPAGYTAWGEAFGDFGRSGTGKSGTLDRTTGGFVAGVDTAVDGIPAGQGRAGFALGYTSTAYRSPLDGGDGTVQAAFGALYGGARFGAVDVRVGGTIGETFNDNRRTVAFPGVNETERSSNNGYAAQVFGEVGYRVPLARVVVEPVAGLAVIHVHQNPFAERGGVAALTGAEEDNDVEVTTLGVRGEAAPFGGAIPVLLHGFLGWQHAFGDVNPATVLAFEAAGANSFTVTGAPVDRDALAAEASLDWRATQALSVGLSYTGLVGRTADDNAVKGRAEYRF